MKTEKYKKEPLLVGWGGHKKTDTYINEQCI